MCLLVWLCACVIMWWDSYASHLMFYAVNDLWLALECIRIFIGHHQEGAAIWCLCAWLGDVGAYVLVWFVCLCACVFVCLYELWDEILMFFYMMVVIGDRPSWLSALIDLSTSDQVSVLNHRLPKYGISVTYTRIEHVVPWYRLHYDWALECWMRL